jgi:hypothetical protein
VGDSAKSRAQSQIDVVRPLTQEILAPPPPLPPPAVRRRTSSSVKGVLVKRKSESQGGDGKRRRSSVTNSPRIESPTGMSKSPTSTIAGNVLSAKVGGMTKVAVMSSSKAPDASKNGTRGGLFAFAHYSDSDDGSE